MLKMKTTLTGVLLIALVAAAPAQAASASAGAGASCEWQGSNGVEHEWEAKASYEASGEIEFDEVGAVGEVHGEGTNLNTQTEAFEWQFNPSADISDSVTFYHRVPGFTVEASASAAVESVFGGVLAQDSASPSAPCTVPEDQDPPPTPEEIVAMVRDLIPSPCIGCPPDHR